MQMTTITELLSTPYYRGNQSLLAKELDVNRGTVRVYAKDIDGKFHFIKVKMDKFQLVGAELFTNQSNKVAK